MRRELELRPLLLAAIGLALGIVAITEPVWLILVAVLGVVCRPLACKTILLVCLITGVILAPKGVAGPSAGSGWFHGEATVVGMPTIEQRGFRCEVRSGVNQYLLECEGFPRLSIGDVLEVAAEVRNVDPTFNVSMGRRGILGVIKAKAADIRVKAEGPSVFRWAAQWRESFITMCNSTLGDRTSTLVQALCFNVRGGISDGDMANLKRTGIVHIVSTSGLHVLILAFSLQFGLGLTPMPRSSQLVVLYLLLAFYACATGLDPPIVRSVLMAAAIMSAPWFEREGDFPSAVGLAAAAFLLWRPLEVFELSFQLSFVAVLALWMFARGAHSSGRGPKALLKAQVSSSVRASAVATLATAPLLARAFGTFSIVAVVANLLVAGTIGPLIVCALVAWAVFPISEALSQGLMHVVVEPLALWVLAVTETLGSQTWSSVMVPELPGLFWGLVYLGAILVWRPIARPA
ncbi:MAG: ComEC/Rec2 family competence protein [Armatimonadetes bacterium]|nr:ComEC/Rec2 family competence protein [Armatimonadota bacterium]